MNNRIVLVKFDTTAGKTDNYPLGIVYIGTALKKAGFEVTLIHKEIPNFVQVKEEIKNINPLFVGFSVITGASVKESVEISKFVKNKLKIPVVWGGIHSTLLKEQCISEKYIDYIVYGEGEKTVVELANSLKNNTPVDNILGLCYKKGIKPIINPPMPFIKDLSESRLDFSILDVKNYFYKIDKFSRAVNYMASRGCPHACNFCYNQNFNHNTWRPFPEEVVIQDINFLKDKHNIDCVFFTDDNFYVNKERAFRILNEIKLPAYTEVRIDYINKDFIEKLKKTNPALVLVGAESGSDRILSLINKRITTQNTKDAVKLFAEYNIPVHYSFILGLPTETKKETEDTIDLMLWIYKTHKNCAFTVGHYMPYPGTVLYKLAISKGFKPPQNTYQWYKVDRFASTLNLPWIDKKFCYYIRWYFFFLYTKVPFIQKICIARLKSRNFLFPVDLHLMFFVYKLAKNKNNPLSKLIWKLMKVFQRKV